MCEMMIKIESSSVIKDASTDEILGAKIYGKIEYNGLRKTYCILASIASFQSNSHCFY